MNRSRATVLLLDGASACMAGSRSDWILEWISWLAAGVGCVRVDQCLAGPCRFAAGQDYVEFLSSFTRLDLACWLSLVAIIVIGQLDE